MHELSVVEEIRQIALRHARSGGVAHFLGSSSNRCIFECGSESVKPIRGPECHVESIEVETGGG